MMQHSDTLTELAKALNALHADLENMLPTAHADTGQFSYSYVELGPLLDMARPLLAKHGFSLVQFPISSEHTEAVGCESVLMHETGEWISGEVLLPLARRDAQAAGGAITYARRYSAAAVLGIAASTDDDAAGSGRQEPKPRDAQQPASQPAARTAEGDAKALFRAGFKAAESVYGNLDEKDDRKWDAINYVCEAFEVRSVREIPAEQQERALKGFEHWKTMKSQPAGGDEYPPF